MDGDANLSFSHIGLFVVDMERIVRFYTDIMGFFVTDRGVLAGNPITFLSRDPKEHHQIVFVAGRTVDRSVKLLNQMSFRIGSLTELLKFVKKLKSADASDFEPVIHGNAWSLYFRDPEGNRVEVFADTDWYIPQPIKVSLDFELNEDEIRSQTYEFCKNQPGFCSRAEWHDRMKRLMEPTTVEI